MDIVNIYYYKISAFQYVLGVSVILKSYIIIYCKVIVLQYICMMKDICFNIA